MDRVQQVPKWKGKLFVDADSAPVCKAARAICTDADGSHAGYDVKGARPPDSTPAQSEESPLGEKPLAAKRWDYWATTDTGGAAASFPNYSEEMHWGSRHGLVAASGCWPNSSMDISAKAGGWHATARNSSEARSHCSRSHPAGEPSPIQTS